MMRPGHLLIALSFILIGLISLFPDATGEALPEEERLDLFSQGKTFFRQANEAAAHDPNAAKELYQKAALRFERIVRDGDIQNGKLYYNIGNTYFRMGDLGQAILNYRRAQRYLPNDSNLQQNLKYARSRRHDKIENEPQTQVLRTLVFWHYDFTTRTRSIVFGICFVIFWLSASIGLFFHKASLRWVLAVSGFLGLLFLGSLISEIPAEGRHQEGVILAGEVIGRKGDGETYQPSFKEPLHTGTEFKLIENRNEWHQIELRDGRRCWIPLRAATRVW